METNYDSCETLDNGPEIVITEADQAWADSMDEQAEAYADDYDADDEMEARQEAASQKVLRMASDGGDYEDDYLWDNQNSD